MSHGTPKYASFKLDLSKGHKTSDYRNYRYVKFHKILVAKN